MLLKDLTRNSGVLDVRGRNDLDIRGICCDSRKVERGFLFIAVKGFAGNGHDHIASALRNGAAAIVYEDFEVLASQLSGISAANDMEAKSGHNALIEEASYVKVSSSRHAMAIIAANFYGHPSEKLNLVGITGTNGKTTTVTLLHSLFTLLGHKSGLFSTIANYVGERRVETINTTADPITINALMSEMVAEGCEYCFMEVSSIGMEQERVSGLKFRAGIFSNLSHDHLDYHKTFAEYLRCKKLFFDNLSEDAFAITNIDDKNGMVMVQNCTARVVTYSCRSMADHVCHTMEESFDGMDLMIDGTETWTRLIGTHNAYNIMAIYVTALCLGLKKEQILLAVSRLGSVKGRLENIRGPRDLSVIIDYAHTPDALGNVLRTLREIGPAKELICVFGCGGDRDKTKRPEMARTAESMCNRIIVTSDNNRTEDIETIMSDIQAGFSEAGMAKTLFIANRREAIRAAIITASNGAIILLAGKGHETYQIMGTEYRHFDEREVVAEMFGKKK